MSRTHENAPVHPQTAARQGRAVLLVHLGMPQGKGLPRGLRWLNPAVGRLRAGFRPADGAPRSPEIPSEGAEVLGATTHLHVEVGGRRLIAAVPSGPSPPAAAAVTLSIDPRWLHFFAADGSSLLLDSPNP